MRFKVYECMKFSNETDDSNIYIVLFRKHIPGSWYYTEILVEGPILSAVKVFFFIWRYGRNVRKREG